MENTIHSRLYTGTVAHRRSEKIDHSFRYRISMAYIDLSELDHLVKDSFLFSTRHKALVEFRRSDYIGAPGISLDSAVRQRVRETTGKLPEGPIRMLTHLRTFGYVFNPVTFYYCFDETDSTVDTIVAEITNTPWKERHSYILTPGMNLSRNKGMYHFRIDKEFHVSPFLDMDYQYDMKFSLPGRNVHVQIENRKEGKRKFIASLFMQSQPFTIGNLLKIMVQYPLMTIKVIAGIYWQAFKLKIKGATYYPNPGSARVAVQKEAV